MSCKVENCRVCDIKITHADTMKYRQRIYNMPALEWQKWLKLCGQHKGTNYFSSTGSFAFIVRCLKSGIKLEDLDD